MGVQELIDLLSDLDPDAEVYVMSQETYPFENALAGVAVREDFIDAEDEDEESEDADEGPVSSHERWSASDRQLPRNDVFLLEGRQLRYGSREAWNVRR